MKKILLITALVFGALTKAQEMDSDLFAVLNNSSLSVFMKSAYTTMEVTTFRASKQQGLVEEYTTTYKKGKINPDRINFTIVYTEFYLLEDRKKSLGKYELNGNYDITKYERSDFDSRNLRTYTFYHSYYYKNSVVNIERIRNKEYIGTGSVEVDTVVTLDSVIYKLDIQEKQIIQTDLAPGGAVTTYLIEGGKLISKISTLTGFAEEDKYSYDAKGQLASIETALVGEDGQRISNLTKIHYSMDGLFSEVIFQDQNGEVLEKKTFTYK
ncbi:MAG: hypothetical protein IPM77_17850 [Crocinitomicaceae bacterium]|nr:hypothetical protein [Crocinitomicaceae bacterium]